MLILIAALAVIGVSASGPIMSVTAAPALAIAFWRNLIGGAVMATPTLVRQPRQFTQLSRREYVYVVAAGVSLALHFACFITSVKLTSVSVATALTCLQPAWIAAFQRMRGAKMPVATLVGLGTALLGVTAITGLDLGAGRDAMTGNLLAVAAGALAALYSMFGGKARETMTTGVYTGLCYGICALVTVPVAALAGQSLIDFPAHAWIGILGVTVAAQLCGHTLFNYLLQQWGALKVSMTILLEIPGTAIIAAIALGERLSLAVYAGLALILLGLLIVVRGQAMVAGQRRRREQRAEKSAAAAPWSS